MKANSKLILAILAVVLIYVFIFVYKLTNNPSAPFVVADYKGDIYSTLESSYCWDGTLSSVCVDTIDPKDFEYERMNAVIDANEGDIIYIDVPDVFDQEDMNINVKSEDIDEIYSFTLTSERGDVTYHFFIK